MKTRKEQLAECEQFLFELQNGIPDDQRLIAGYAKDANVQTDETGRKINAGFWPTPYKPGKYIDENSNAYVCISSSIKTPNPKTQKMRYWRGEASFGRGLAIMVDDIGTGTGSKGGLTVEELSAILVPTAVVETSPWNHQLWYFLARPEDDMVRFKAFLSCFVEKVLQKGGDNTIKDVSRYGRMPIGYNNKRHADGSLKYPDENGRPFRVQLLAADYSRRYEMDEIARAFGFDIVVPVRQRVLSEDISRAEVDMDKYWLNKAEAITNKLKMGEGSDGEVVMNMSGKYRIRCPWGDEHTNGDQFGAYFRGPIPGAEVEFVFGCGHDTCRKDNKRTWSSFVDAIVMPFIINRLDDANGYVLAVEDWYGEQISKTYKEGSGRFFVPWPKRISE